MEEQIESIKEYGKFKSAEELLAAYNALEREFTKRCQLIKTLQTAEHACAQENAEAEAPLSEDKTKPDTADIKEHGAAAPAPEAPHIEEQHGEEAPVAPITQDPAPTEMPTTRGIEQSDIIGYCVENAEIAELLSEIPQVMDACIAKYKQRLIGMGATVNAVRGAAVITPVRRPKTLKEAKMLADEMLRN
ncbi:MAG: hypothetical protein K2M48_02405 [Clostridiales bacterium]|nr:hypothetical protein [Clostridiales bacterium]